MDNIIKLSLSIILPGSVLDSRANKNVPKNILKVKSKSAKQVINITKEAYDYFISNEKPYGFKGSWDKQSINQKINWHANRIAQYLGGSLESFQIFS